MASYLTPDKVIKATIGGKTIKISQKIIPDGARADKYVASHVQKGDLVKPNAKVNNGTGKPRGITVHNTSAIKVNATTTQSEQYARATYPNLNMKGAIVSYYVSGYDAIWQMLNTEPGQTERGWHASDSSTRRSAHDGAKYTTIGGNLDCISIECIGNSVEAEDATALLVAYLCKKHNLNPKIDVYTHNYFMKLPDKIVTGVDKNCPLYILPHWDKFLSTVEEYYNGVTTSTPKEKYYVCKSWRDISSQLGVYTSLSTAKKNCKPGYSVFDSSGIEVYSNEEKVDVVYQAYSKNKWWGKIKNYNLKNSSGYAGVEKYPIQCLKVHLSKGDIQYRVHTIGGKWLNWITNDSNPIASMSYAGIYGKNIDMIQMRLVGAAAEDYDVYYRVSTTGSTGYLNWIKGISGSGEMSYAGIANNSIDKIQIYIQHK